MLITVTTESGSIYFFKEVDGKTHVTRNMKNEGILAEPLKIIPGQPLLIKFNELNSLTYTPSKEISFWESTPVAEVKIIQNA